LSTPESAAVKITSYDLRYRIDFNEQKLFCAASLTLNHVKTGDTLHLLLYRLLKVRSVATSDGRKLRFSQNVISFSDWDNFQVNSISIYLAGASKINIEYDGYLFGYIETGMSYVKDHINPEFTILRMDSYAYPVQGITNWENNRAEGLSNFNYKVSVRIPDSLNVINGGKLVSKVNYADNTTEYIYINNKPAWRIDLAIAKYQEIHDKGFSVYYFPQDSLGAKVISTNIRKVSNLYSAWFGNISSSGYSIIELPDDYGSQADVSCILQTAAAFKSDELMYELYHEISHLWNVSANDKQPCRLESEGLAMFLQYLTVEKLNDKHGYLDSAVAKTLFRLKKKLDTDTQFAKTPMIDYGKKNMTSFSYTKGLLFFYLFYKLVGEESFLSGLKMFYNEYRGSGATTRQFTDFIAKNVNNKRIGLLVNSWVFTNESSQQIKECIDVDDLLAKSL
jgi:hypothetical protein